MTTSFTTREGAKIPELRSSLHGLARTPSPVSGATDEPMTLRELLDTLQCLGARALTHECPSADWLNLFRVAPGAP